MICRHAKLRIPVAALRCPRPGTAIWRQRARQPGLIRSSSDGARKEGGSRLVNTLDRVVREIAERWASPSRRHIPAWTGLAGSTASGSRAPSFQASARTYGPNVQACDVVNNSRRRWRGGHFHLFGSARAGWAAALSCPEECRESTYFSRPITGIAAGTYATVRATFGGHGLKWLT